MTRGAANWTSPLSRCHSSLFPLFLLPLSSLSCDGGDTDQVDLQAIARMLILLSLIGYVLVYIFQSESALIISGVLAVMLIATSWIALNTVTLTKGWLFPASLVSVVLGGGSTLLLITQGVLQLDPWYQPSAMIPLAGIIFAAAGLSTVRSLTMIRKTEHFRQIQ